MTSRGRRADFGERKTVVSVSITPTLRKFFAETCESASHEIERSVRSTIKFIEWERKQNEDVAKSAAQSEK